MLLELPLDLQVELYIAVPIVIGTVSANIWIYGFYSMKCTILMILVLYLGHFTVLNIQWEPKVGLRS